MSFWLNKQVLVTGATGFLGFWLTQKLIASGASVIAFIRDHNTQSELYRSGLVKEISVVTGCLENCYDLERTLTDYNIDTIFHLGAQTLVGAAAKAPLLTFEANIRGTYHLLEACRRYPGALERIVIASSDKAYGSSPILPYTENMSLQGQFPYDVSKSCCDLISKCYAHTYGLPISIARCGNLFGGGDLNWSRLIPGTIRSLLTAQSPVLRSDGTFIRDYLYIADAVDAYLCLAEKMSQQGVVGEAFNFAPSRPYSVLEIVHLLQDILECPHIEPIIQNGARCEIKEQYLTSKKAEGKLGWTAKYEMDVALEETVVWYREFLSKKTRQSYALC